MVRTKKRQFSEIEPINNDNENQLQQKEKTSAAGLGMLQLFKAEFPEPGNNSKGRLTPQIVRFTRRSHTPGIIQTRQKQTTKLTLEILHLKKANAKKKKETFTKDTILFVLWRKEAELLTSFCKQPRSIKVTHTGGIEKPNN